MKKLIFIFILCNSVALTIKAQSYNPLLENNKYWDVMTHTGPEENPYCSLGGGARYFLNGDTVINGKTYKKIYAQGFIGDPFAYPYFCPPYLVDTISYITNSFIREDTLEKKVYYYDNYIFTAYSTCIIDSEVVLYDFNVQQGDTLKCIAASYGDCGFGSVVDSVRYELNHGVNRKVIYFFTQDGFVHNNSMIEGIGGGGSGGLFQPILMGEYFWYYLDCIMKYDTMGSLLYGGGCADYITNSQDYYYNHNELNIYPNPTDGRIFFSKALNEKIIIFNVIGEIVLNIRNIGIKGIDISTLPKGIYYIKVANRVYKIVKY